MCVVLFEEMSDTELSEAIGRYRSYMHEDNSVGENAYWQGQIDRATAEQTRRAAEMSEDEDELVTA